MSARRLYPIICEDVLSVRALIIKEGIPRHCYQASKEECPKCVVELHGNRGHDVER